MQQAGLTRTEDLFQKVEIVAVNDVFAYEITVSHERMGISLGTQLTDGLQGLQVVRAFLDEIAQQQEHIVLRLVVHFLQQSFQQGVISVDIRDGDDASGCIQAELSCVNASIHEIIPPQAVSTALSSTV